jgi:hypothetical protein
MTSPNPHCDHLAARPGKLGREQARAVLDHHLAQGSSRNAGRNA